MCPSFISTRYFVLDDVNHVAATVPLALLQQLMWLLPYTASRGQMLIVRSRTHLPCKLDLLEQPYLSTAPWRFMQVAPTAPSPGSPWEDAGGSEVSQEGGGIASAAPENVDVDSGGSRVCPRVRRPDSSWTAATWTRPAARHNPEYKLACNYLAEVPPPGGPTLTPLLLSPHSLYHLPSLNKVSSSTKATLRSSGHHQTHNQSATRPKPKPLWSPHPSSETAFALLEVLLRADLPLGPP